MEHQPLICSVSRTRSAELRDDVRTDTTGPPARPASCAEMVLLGVQLQHSESGARRDRCHQQELVQARLGIRSGSCRTGIHLHRQIRNRRRAGVDVERDSGTSPTGNNAPGYA